MIDKMSQVIKLLHLTDLHLFGDINSTLNGINPLQTLSRIIETISNTLKNTQLDAIVLTGDISQDYSLASYKNAKKLLETLNLPVFATMGNHDYLSYFNKIFGNPNQTINQISNIDGWQIILVNTQLYHHVDGLISDDDLLNLEQTLAKNPQKPTVIFLHHQVLPIESAWIDKLGLQHPQQFLKIIDQYSNIKAVVCGHVHQDTTHQRNNVQFWSTPATSWQFTVKNEVFKLDPLMPGYRLINLHPDGTITTEVIRIEHDDAFFPDPQSKGY